MPRSGWAARRRVYTYPTCTGLDGAGEGAEAPEGAVVSRENIPPPPCRGREGNVGAGTALYRGERSPSPLRSGEAGGCLGEGPEPGGGEEEGARVPPRRARSPSSCAMMTLRGAGEGGPAAGGPPGAARHWCGNPEARGAAPRSDLLLLCGNRCANREQLRAGAGAG